MGTGGRARVGDLSDELGGQPPGLVVIAARDANQAGFVGVEIELGGGALGFIKQPAHLVGGETPVGDLAESRKLLGAIVYPAGRHVRFLVPREYGGGAIEVGDLRQDRFQLFQRVRHAPSPSRVFSLGTALRPASSVDRASAF